VWVHGGLALEERLDLVRLGAGDVGEGVCVRSSGRGEDARAEVREEDGEDEGCEGRAEHGDWRDKSGQV
jgi:hypothetical protein